MPDYILLKVHDGQIEAFESESESEEFLEEVELTESNFVIDKERGIIGFVVFPTEDVQDMLSQWEKCEGFEELEVGGNWRILFAELGQAEEEMTQMFCQILRLRDGNYGILIWPFEDIKDLKFAFSIKPSPHDS